MKKIALIIILLTTNICLAETGLTWVRKIMPGSADKKAAVAEGQELLEQNGLRVYGSQVGYEKYAGETLRRWMACYLVSKKAAIRELPPYFKIARREVCSRPAARIH